MEPCDWPIAKIDKTRERRIEIEGWFVGKPFISSFQQYMTCVPRIYFSKFQNFGQMIYDVTGPKWDQIFFAKSSQKYFSKCHRSVSPH